MRESCGREETRLPFDRQQSRMASLTQVTACMPLLLVCSIIVSQAWRENQATSIRRRHSPRELRELTTSRQNHKERRSPAPPSLDFSDQPNWNINTYASRTLGRKDSSQREKNCTILLCLMLILCNYRCTCYSWRSRALGLPRTIFIRTFSRAWPLKMHWIMMVYGATKVACGQYPVACYYLLKAKSHSARLHEKFLELW